MSEGYGGRGVVTQDIISRIAFNVNGGGPSGTMDALAPSPMAEEISVLAEQVGPIEAVAKDPPPSVIDGIELHMSSRNATGYKNVYATGTEFVVNHWSNGRTEHLGYYPTATEAAMAYAHHVIRVHAAQAAEANGEPPPPKPLPPRKAPRALPADLVSVHDGMHLVLSDRSATGYKCVYKNGSGFSVDIGAGDGKMLHIGSYRSVLDAAVAYARYVMQQESLPTQSPEAMASWAATWTPDVLANHAEICRRMLLDESFGGVMSIVSAEASIEDPEQDDQQRCAQQQHQDVAQQEDEYFHQQHQDVQLQQHEHQHFGHQHDGISHSVLEGLHDDYRL